MPAARGGRFLEPFQLGVVVDQTQGDRGAGGDAVVRAGVDDHPICLEGLSLTPAITPLAAFQFDVDQLGVEGDARGKAFDDRGEGRPVGFAGGQVAEHVISRGRARR